MESVEQAWLLMLTALPRLFEGDAEVLSSFVDAGETAERLADPDATIFARLCRGYALILQGETGEGMALLDEVMVSVTAGEAAPILVGIADCQVIALCHVVFDLRRAREWTEALTRWCDSQPDLVSFRGHCLVHRCEIFQLEGAWTKALDFARHACELLAGPPAWDVLGSAYYQLAEIQRLRGEFAEAEDSYRRASQAGRDPEPGLSLPAWRRGDSISLCRRSAAPWRRPRIPAPGHACSPLASSSCWRPRIWRQRARLPMSSLGSPLRSLRRI